MIPMPVSASGTTQTIDEPRDQKRPRVFPCERCGADLEFQIGAQSLQCRYCGFIKPLDVDPTACVAEQDYIAALERTVGQRREMDDGEPDCQEVRCDGCGATVRFIGTLTSSECAYCGVPLLLGHAHGAEDHIPVDGVLPFLIDRPKAQANLAEWVRSRWFAPNDFRSRGVQGRFNGIYLPYWTYDSLTWTHYAGERGEHYWVTVGSGKHRRRVRRTRWYPASGAFHRFFDDVLVIAGQGLPTKRLIALEPWPLNQCVPFNAELLAGLLARTYDVPLDAGFVEARDRMAQALRAEVAERIGGDAQRIHSIDTRHDAITYKHLLLPVWMLSYRHHERAYQVVVNACTGEVQGDRPCSWIKITLAILVALATAALVYVAIQWA